jgi:hypothetical protein
MLGLVRKFGDLKLVIEAASLFQTLLQGYAFPALHG